MIMAFHKDWVLDWIDIYRYNDAPNEPGFMFQPNGWIAIRVRDPVVTRDLFDNGGKALVAFLKTVWEIYVPISAFREAQCSEWYNELESWLEQDTDDIDPELIDKAITLCKHIEQTQVSLKDEALELLQSIKSRRDLANRADLRGYIYLLAGGGYYKIGHTNNIQRRSRQLSIQLPFDVDLVHAIKVADKYSAEILFHNLFAANRTNGEWFELDDDEVEWFTSLGNPNKALPISELEVLIAHRADQMLDNCPEVSRIRNTGGTHA